VPGSGCAHLRPGQRCSQHLASPPAARPRRLPAPAAASRKRTPQ
jgi:hypothetical protein